MALNRDAIELPDLRGPINFCRQIVHIRHYTGADSRAPKYDKQLKQYSDMNIEALAGNIRRWGRDLGFQQVGFSQPDLDKEEQDLARWLEQGFHGQMSYMSRHGTKRSRPAQLLPGTVSIISARMDYWPASGRDALATLQDAESGFVSRYALGRDYHKVLRRRLQRLANRISREIGEFGYRVFTDSAPVMEKPLAQRAGLGWIGKHTNLINKEAGSWFFLGEIYTDLTLPAEVAATDHCGSCHTCIDVCPTGAIVAPYQLDARRCISYLTIELHGSIPERFRKAIGNRIYGCDDCQLFCPWNKFARPTAEDDFAPRHGLDDTQLADLFAWSESEFLNRTEGSAIRRIGYERWLRNIAVALGNAPSTTAVLAALNKRRSHDSQIVREHVAWALQQHRTKKTNPDSD